MVRHHWLLGGGSPHGLILEKEPLSPNRQNPVGSHNVLGVSVERVEVPGYSQFPMLACRRIRDMEMSS